MLRDFWNRHVRRARASAVERETEREQMSPDERRFDEESFDDMKLDTLVEQRPGNAQTAEPSSDEGEPLA